MMAERTIELTVKPRLDAVVVRPGDTLVIRVAVDYTREQVDEYRNLLQQRLPGVKAVFVAADQLVVYRPDGAGEDG